MLSYPLQVSPIGGLLLSEDPERDKILLLLDCRYWERVMVPDFGNPIYPFDPIDAIWGEWIAALELALGYWVGDGITVEPVPDSTEIEAGTISLLIRYGNGAGLIEYTLDRQTLMASIGVEQAPN
jgi:hypothetical protein